MPRLRHRLAAFSRDIVNKTNIVIACAVILSVVGVLVWQSRDERRLAATQLQCGHWAVVKCGRLLGFPVSSHTVSTILPRRKEGHSLRELQQAFHAIGAQAEATRRSWESLLSGDFPCIAHLKDPDHFVVVSGVDSQGVHLYDDAGRRRTIARELLEKRYSGYAVKVSRDATADSRSLAGIQFDTLLQDAGSISAHSGVVTYEFPFRNRSDADLAIEKVHLDCACMDSEWPTTPIGAGQAGQIRLRYRVRPEKGSFIHRAIVITNDPKAPRVVLEATGYSGMDASVRPEILELGQLVEAREHVATCLVTYTGDWLDFRIMGIDDSKLQGAKVSRFVNRLPTEEPDPDGGGRQYFEPPNNVRVVEISVEPQVPAGERIDGSISIETNLDDYESLVIPVRGEVVGPVRPFPSVLLFGDSPQGDREQIVTLVSVGGDSFEVEAVEIVGADAAALSVEYPASPATELAITVKADRFPGSDSVAIVRVKTEFGERRELRVEIIAPRP